MVLDARRWIERLLVDEQLLAGLAESTQQTLKLRLRQLAEHHLTDCDGDLAAYETIARLKRIARAIRQLLLANNNVISTGVSSSTWILPQPLHLMRSAGNQKT